MKAKEENRSIYTRVLSDIGSGYFKAGSRLKVSELAKRYGTSIIPVREALRLLQGEGIVTIAPNKGATVSSFDTDALRDIFEILQLLEPYFVEAYAKSCTEDDLIELEAIQAEIEKTAPENRLEFAEVDRRFHEAIARKHYNTRAFSIWSLQKGMLNTMAMSVPISRSRHADIISEHRTLIAAFRNNDTRGAVECIKRHVEGAGSQMHLQLKAKTA